MDEIARGGALSCGGLYEELIEMRTLMIEMRTLMRADRALRDQVDEVNRPGFAGGSNS